MTLGWAAAFNAGITGAPGTVMGLTSGRVTGLMISMIVIGAVIGALAFAILWHLAPPKPSAIVQLARFDARQRADVATPRAGVDRQTPLEALQGNGDGDPAPAASWVGSRLGRRIGERITGRIVAEVERLGGGTGMGMPRLRQDLAMTGDTLESLVVRQLGGFLAGFGLVAATAVGLRVGAGIAIPVSSPLLLAIVVGFAFSTLPIVDARRQAAARRAQFRRSLAAWMDLVALEMAGSAAPVEALPAAARVGAGWPMALLRDTLHRATLAGQDHWQALADLGTRIGVSELRTLGALVQLVGRDGAKVRETLTARAATMRSQQLAEITGEAGVRDQSMLMAQVLIGFGFFVFLGYPAVTALMDL